MAQLRGAPARGLWRMAAPPMLRGYRLMQPFQQAVHQRSCTFKAMQSRSDQATLWQSAIGQFIGRCAGTLEQLGNLHQGVFERHPGAHGKQRLVIGTAIAKIALGGEDRKIGVIVHWVESFR